MGLRNVDGVVKPLPSTAGSRQKPTLPVLGKLSQRIIFDDQLLTLGSRLAATDLKVACAAAKNLGYALLRNASAQREAIRYGIPELLDRMFDPDKTDLDAVSAATRTLIFLIHHGRSDVNVHAQDAMGLAGAVERLVHLVSGGAGPLPESAMADVCTALAVVCARHPVNQNRAQSMGAVEALISLVGFSRYEHVRHRACFALGSLAASNAPLRSYIVMQGGVRTAASMLDQTEDEVSIMHTLAAIRALSLGHLEGQLEALATGVHDACLARLHGVPRVAAAACETLACILQGSASSQKRLRGGAGVRGLVEVLPRVIEDLDALVTGGIVVDADGNPVRGADGQHVKIDRLLEHANGYVGPHNQIMDCSGKPLVGKDDKPLRALPPAPTQAGYGRGDAGGAATPLEDLCATTCRAIDALATGDGACQSAIVHFGGLRWLLKLAKATPPSYHPEIINAAFGAIAALAPVGHSEHQQLVLDGGGVTLMLQAIERWEEQLGGAVYRCLAAFVQDRPAERKRVADALGRDSELIRLLLLTLRVHGKQLPMRNWLGEVHREGSEEIDISQDELLDGGDSRAAKESVVALATLITVFLAHGYGRESVAHARLSAHELLPLLRMLPVEGETAHSAIACMLQLINTEAVPPSEVLNAMQLFESQGLKDLIRLLAGPDDPIDQDEDAGEQEPQAQLIQAAMTLVTTLTSDDGAARALREGGVVKAIVAELCSSGAMLGSAASLTALAALTALMTSDSSCQDAARDARVLPPLVALIKEGGTTTKLYALSALTAFIARNHENRHAVRSTDAIKVCISLISHTSGDGVPERATLALLHIAAGAERDTSAGRYNQNMIRMEGGIPPLVAFQAYAQGPSQSLADRALFELSFNNPRNADLIEEARRAVIRGLLHFERPQEWAQYDGRRRRYAQPSKAGKRVDQVLVQITSEEDPDIEPWIHAVVLPEVGYVPESSLESV